MEYIDELKKLLNNPDRLRQEEPFTRGMERDFADYGIKRSVSAGETITAELPQVKQIVVSQQQFMRELDPRCHDVLFDENIPSICVKVADHDYRDIKHKRMAIPLQQIIKNTQVIYLTNHPMQFTQVDKEPTEQQKQDFITFKQYWDLRNQDGMKNKMVDTQLSVGKAGLLYYFDRKGRIKSRILSYPKYKLCSHNDKNGDRIIETVYYKTNEWIDNKYIETEYLDSYDDTFLYRCKKQTGVNTTSSGWTYEEPVEHGFSEIPLITKRGNVAWDGGQTAIEAFEEVFNVFNAIQKRFGWGIFYIKGQFKETSQRIAGSVVLNDRDAESGGDAKFLTPPSPEGMLDTLKNLLRTIQLSTSTTFILPDDINMSGDVSGIAVQLTKELDLQNAMQKVIDWQNVADKMTRLFKEGLAKELVNTGEHPTALTSFADLHINAKFKVWKPFSDTEYNNMILSLANGGLISKQTGIESNTISRPDELIRIEKENEENTKKAQMFSSQQQIEKHAEDSTENNNKREEDLE